MLKPFKKQIMITIDDSTIEYFKSMAAADGIPYQTLVIHNIDIANKSE